MYGNPAEIVPKVSCCRTGQSDFECFRIPLQHPLHGLAIICALQVLEDISGPLRCCRAGWSEASRGCWPLTLFLNSCKGSHVLFRSGLHRWRRCLPPWCFWMPDQRARCELSRSGPARRSDLFFACAPCIEAPPPASSRPSLRLMTRHYHRRRAWGRPLRGSVSTRQTDELAITWACAGEDDHLHDHDRLTAGYVRNPERSPSHPRDARAPRTPCTPAGASTDRTPRRSADSSSGSAWA